MSQGRFSFSRIQWLSFSASAALHLSIALGALWLGPSESVVYVPLEVSLVNRDSVNSANPAAESGTELKSRVTNRTERKAAPQPQAIVPIRSLESPLANVVEELKASPSEDKGEREGEGEGANAGAMDPRASAQPSGGVIGSVEQLYLSELRRLLESRKEYPMMAQRLGHKGRVMVELVLGKDGNVIEARIVEPTRSDLLNRATEKLIRSVSALKPFPPEIRQDRWSVKIPIEYLL